MKVVILGSGRMGIRHAEGIIDLSEVEDLCIVDKYSQALKNAEIALKKYKGFNKARFLSLSDFLIEDTRYAVAIIATTSKSRLNNCRILLEKGVKYFLIEKPLGQSFNEVKELVDFFDENKNAKAFVNLNMRLYQSFIDLKHDLQSLPQFNGVKTVTLNTGSIGIGANGIHYLDLIYFLFDADNAIIRASEIDDQMLKSARGEDFADFGGWGVFDFTKGNEKVCTALLSISSRSSAFGGWEIIGPHGRILIDEIQQKRINIYRKHDSDIPIYRYAVDYLNPIEEKIISPFLGSLTSIWLSKLINNIDVLPELKDSLKVHQLMFDWLSASKSGQSFFPIT